MEEANTALAKGDEALAGRQIDIALVWSTGPEKVKAYFDQQPSALAAYVRYVNGDIANIKNVSAAQSRRELLATLRADAVLPPSQLDLIDQRFNATLADSNTRGVLNASLADKISPSPALAAPAQRRLVLENTISTIRQNPHLIRRPVPELLAYYQGPDTPEGDKALIRTALPSLNLKRDELKEVEAVLPSFATSQLNALTVTAVLQVAGADRLFKDDLEKSLQRIGVVWVNQPNATTPVVVVERLRQSESAQPDRTETIRYAAHQVDILKAADGKQIHEELVRGEMKTEGRRCQNVHVQNVFGGSQAVDFIANDDMAARCTGGQADSMQTLRDKVAQAIAAAVFRVPSIKAVVEAL